MLICCCISFDSYIKPQLFCFVQHIFFVVYLLIPTSNHNCRQSRPLWYQLYIFWFLHQTTTKLANSLSRSQLYIFWFLHQTTTCYCCWICSDGCISFDSYIKPQLRCPTILLYTSCISFDSYIKPQLIHLNILFLFVVYLLIPTSNHNL